MDIILDVDTGVDDAMAILLAVHSPALKVLGITCVMGNTDIDHVVTNTLKVLEVAGAADIPVARGMDRPLLEAQRNAKRVHGDDGLGGIELLRNHLAETSSANPKRLILKWVYKCSW